VTIKVPQKKTHTNFRAASRSYLSEHISEEISSFTTKQHERETGPLSPRKFRLRLKLTFSETPTILDMLSLHHLTKWTFQIVVWFLTPLACAQNRILPLLQSFVLSIKI